MEHSIDTAPVFGPILFLCCGLVPALLLLALWLWALIDCVQREFKGNDKIVWVLVIVLLSWIGAIIYLIFGRPQSVPRDATGTTPDDHPHSPPPPPPPPAA